MATAALYLAASDDRGRPLAICEVRDKELLLQTAKTAVSEAEARVKDQTDEDMRAVCSEELRLLRRRLARLVPGFGAIQ